MADIGKIIEDLAKNVGKESVEVLKKHEDTLKEMGKEELSLLFHYISDSNEDAVNGILYAALLRKMEDKEFLDLRNKTVESMRKWQELDSKKKAIANDLISTVKKSAADLIIKSVLLA